MITASPGGQSTAEVEIRSSLHFPLNQQRPGWSIERTLIDCKRQIPKSSD